jgi:hypothetical protein
MEAINGNSKTFSFWPYRHVAILLYTKGVISRKEFIELWRLVYGKD